MALLIPFLLRTGATVRALRIGDMDQRSAVVDITTSQRAGGPALSKELTDEQRARLRRIADSDLPFAEYAERLLEGGEE